MGGATGRDSFDSFISTPQTIAVSRASYKAQHFKSLPILWEGPLAAMFFDSFNSNPKTSPRVAPPTKHNISNPCQSCGRGHWPRFFLILLIPIPKPRRGSRLPQKTKQTYRRESYFLQKQQIQKMRHLGAFLITIQLN